MTAPPTTTNSQFNEPLLAILMEIGRKRGRFAIPLVRHAESGALLDGHHRQEAVRRVMAEDGTVIGHTFIEIPADDPETLAVELNQYRRQWSTAEERRTQAQLVSGIEIKGGRGEGGKPSTRQIAQALGCHHRTVERDLESDAGGAFAPPANPATSDGAEPPKGKRVNAPPADRAEKERARAMKAEGMTNTAIAQELGRKRHTVGLWLKDDPSKDESHSVKPEAIERPAKPSKPQIPPTVREMHNKERRWVKERWEPAARHLRSAYELIRAENDRLGAQYAGKHGSIIMQRRWQALADAWQANGVLGEFPSITGEQNTAELDALLLEMERMARMTRAWVDSLRMYTGCRPCNTRWKGDATAPE